MNISLTAASKSTCKIGGKVVSVGLNRRGPDADATSTRTSNVFGDDVDDDEEDDDHNVSGRGTVNRELAAEQAALRKRAADAAAAGKDTSMYEYDAVYDDDKATQHHKEQQSSQQQAADARKGSRYIGDLLQAAEQRKRQRDIVYERKLAKEQEAEAAAADGALPEERFITKAYKRKLQERQLWLEQEEARAREEEANDVTKQNKGGDKTALVKFYGNILSPRDVTLGGSGVRNNRPGVNDKTNPSSEDHDDDGIQENNKKDEGGTDAAVTFSFTEGFERATDDVEQGDPAQHDEDNEGDRQAEQYPTVASSAKSAATTNDLSSSFVSDSKVLSSTNASSTRQPLLAPLSPSPAEMRKARHEKVQQARLRYFRRKGMLVEEQGGAPKQTQ